MIIVRSYFLMIFSYILPIIADPSLVKKEDGLFGDTDSVFKPVEEEEEEEEEEEDNDLGFEPENLEEFEGKSTMPPSTRNLLSTANKPSTY